MTSAWVEDSRAYTAAAMARVAALLDRDVQRQNAADQELVLIGSRMSSLPALAALESALGLSGFERDVLILCAGVELDARVRRALSHRAARAGDREGAARDEHDEGGGGDAPAATAEVPAPTFALALAAFPDAHWSALTPAAPLRRWRLIEVAPGPVLVSTPLSIAERVLHYLGGIHYIDDETGMRPPVAPAPVGESHLSLVRAAAALLAGDAASDPPLIQLVVAQSPLGEAVAAGIAAEVGLAAGIVAARDILPAGTELLDRTRAIERETVLAGLLPVLVADRGDLSPAALLADALTGPVIVIARSPLAVRRADARISVPPSPPEERMQMWRAALGENGAAIIDEVRHAAEAFDLDPLAIQSVAAEFIAARSDDPESPAGGRFWTLARERARPRLNELAQRVQRHATWDDLVLPAAQLQILRDIADQVRWRALVHREWGLGPDTGEGMGIAALFAGPSGTGKTMAASVIATDLGLDLFRVDLSQVVSKYIGETEKNLSEIFSATEGSGSILLFDEADALFGKRSEVRDSHDRYANLEVSYLLQRMEAYSGLAILTTNQPRGLDQAFARRLRFVVPFAVPDQSSRAEIWRRVYPDGVPREDLDAELLAQLAVPGGNIRTIALNAAFHAAARGGGVSMTDILRATRSEFVKLERSLPEAQVRGWA